VFRRSHIDDRAVADYVAEMLAEFSRLDRTRCAVRGQDAPLDYFFEMVAALRTADEHTDFHIRVHIGNHSLFLTGVFPSRLRARAEQRSFPGLKYYEDLGRASFRTASDHRLARRHNLTGIFTTLAERFQTTRLALNNMTDRLLALGDIECGPLALLDPGKAAS
jgi:hypothetical protein